MSSVKLNKFLKRKLEGVNPSRFAQQRHFFRNEENLVTLNADFLKSIRFEVFL
jgi:hypothetical protein